MKTFYYNKTKETLYQVNKQKANRLFNEGRTIYVKQNNANVNSPWIGFIDIKKSEIDSFEKFLNDWYYYNPRNELGYYPQFFIKNI